MNDYVTIQEAVNLTGKSVSTIRRVVKRLSTDNLKKEGDKYLIKRDVLFKELGLDSQNQVSIQDSQTDSQPSQRNSQVDSQGDIVTILREQLRIKDEQIAHLLERQRETNILLNNMRLLTAKEPVEQGKTAREIRRENIILIIVLVVVVVIIAAVVWVSWR